MWSAAGERNDQRILRQQRRSFARVIISRVIHVLGYAVRARARVYVCAHACRWRGRVSGVFFSSSFRDEESCGLIDAASLVTSFLSFFVCCVTKRCHAIVRNETLTMSYKSRDFDVPFLLCLHFISAQLPKLLERRSRTDRR